MAEQPMNWKKMAILVALLAISGVGSTFQYIRLDNISFVVDTGDGVQLNVWINLRIMLWEAGALKFGEFVR